MPDLSFSTTQLQALYTLFLSQGSNLPEELKLLLGSLQIQLEGNFSPNPSFPTPSPSPERPSKAARATKYLSIKTRPKPPWLASKSRTTCEAGIQVDLDLAAQDNRDPPLSLHRDGDSLHDHDFHDCNMHHHPDLHHNCNRARDLHQTCDQDRARDLDQDRARDHGCTRDRTRDCTCDLNCDQNHAHNLHQTCGRNQDPDCDLHQTRDPNHYRDLSCDHDRNLPCDHNHEHAHNCHLLLVPHDHHNSDSLHNPHDSHHHHGHDLLHNLDHNRDLHRAHHPDTYRYDGNSRQVSPLNSHRSLLSPPIDSDKSPSRDTFSDLDALCPLDLDDTHYADSPSFCPKDNFRGNELPPSDSSAFEADDSDYKKCQ
ncbi:hypothetical protein F5876DRAFT_80846 [Lentinula aff. lateritia]|uniref:Uncharacterized protein n=1 Tax=Lentinula aff. lateritia TaxID=2804960 RepID=A0ACC1TNQ5_9AGAR|nr:hypothetical protein F5876DRAFT_80846 [Lentinula aff. lateritia]